MRELARRNLLNFNKYVYPNYKVNWHIELLCQALDLVIEGKIRFLIVEMPPRHSKSLNVSQLFPAYVVGRNKDDSVIVASYSGDLATDHGRETRNLIATQEYQNIFDTKLAADSNAKGKWNTNGKGAYNAAGVGGSITGKGAKYFVVDDPFKDRKEADSELIREERWKWFRSVARTRLTPDGGMVLMHTRWHDDDLIGKVTREDDWVDYFDFLEGKKAKWVRLTLPAIAEKDEKYRKQGEALWPGHYNLDELMSIKSDLGSYEWSALYQQNPLDEESQEFKKHWFKEVEMYEVDKFQTRRFITIDTAISEKAISDNTGITINYVNQQNFWHLKAFKIKVSPTDLIELLFTLFDSVRPEKIGIEKTIYLQAIKPFLDEEMRRRNKFLPIVELDHQQTAKELRIRGLTPRYENGSIFHIKGECKDLEEELLRFPKSVHDDVMDSAAYQSQIAEPPLYNPVDEIRLQQARQINRQFR